MDSIAEKMIEAENREDWNNQQTNSICEQVTCTVQILGWSSSKHTWTRGCYEKTSWRSGDCCEDRAYILQACHRNEVIASPLLFKLIRVSHEERLSNFMVLLSQQALEVSRIPQKRPSFFPQQRPTHLRKHWSYYTGMWWSSYNFVEWKCSTEMVYSRVLRKS